MRISFILGVWMFDSIICDVIYCPQGNKQFIYYTANMRKYNALILGAHYAV